ncbi:hypothetical protein Tco_1505860 [Tanacetum coccineum]
MANQEQNPPQQQQPFVAAKQVGFNLEDIILNTNNEVALLYPEHNNKDHFKCVSDFISKCCLRKPFTISPNMNAIGAHYLPYSSEYVAPPSIDIVRPWFEIIGYGETVPSKGTLKKSLLPPRRSMFWEDIIIKLNKKHRENVIPYTRFISLLMMHKMKEGYGDGELTLYPTQVFNVNNWTLKPNQPKEPPFTDHMLAIYVADMPMVFKAPKTSSKAESVSQGTKSGAKHGHKKLSTFSKQPFVSSSKVSKGGSSKAPTSSKTGHSKKRKESSSAMDSNPSQPPVYTPMDTRMHKEDQQATSGRTSLGVTSEHLSLSASKCDASADSIAEVDPRLSAPSTDPHVLADKTKSVSEGLEILSFKDLDSPEDDHVIVVDDSDEDEEDEVHVTTNAKTKDTSVPKSSSLNSSQIQELTNQVLILLSQKHKLELEKNEAEALKLNPPFLTISLPTELKDLPSKFNELTKETVKSLTSQVVELKTLQWELSAEFLALPKQVLDSASGDQSVPSAGQADTMPAEGEKNTNQATISQLFQKRAENNAEKENLNNQQPKSTTPPATTIIPPKDKGKQAMSLEDAEEVSTESDFDDETTYVPGSIIESSKKKDLKKFDFVNEDGDHVHLTEEQINAQKKIEEEAKAEATRREGEMWKKELIDLLGTEVVNKYYNDKRGPITLKVYREDDTSEIIPEFKASDLLLGEWREVVKACSNKKGKGWVSINKQIHERMDYLCTTEAELGINLDKPLSEQDPLDRQNDLSNKKRKHADEIHDFFRANKRLKSSVQYEDHPARTVLNEPVLAEYNNWGVTS